MSLENARSLLRKIQNLLENIESESTGISQIEKDLMTSYVRRFYACFSNDDLAPAPYLQAESEAADPKEVLHTDLPAPEPAFEIGTIVEIGPESPANPDEENLDPRVLNDEPEEEEADEEPEEAPEEQPSLAESNERKYADLLAELNKHDNSAHHEEEPQDKVRPAESEKVEATGHVDDTEEQVTEEHKEDIVNDTPVSEPAYTPYVELSSTPVEEKAPPTFFENLVSKSQEPEITVHKDLFDVKESGLLSEKFSNLPIQDIGRAMGLNERILVTNDLFHGSVQALEEVLKTLNQFETFDQAKAFLSTNIADKYQWSDPVRIERARTFIKLVKRRYVKL